MVRASWAATLAAITVVFSVGGPSSASVSHPDGSRTLPGIPFVSSSSSGEKPSSNAMTVDQIKQKIPHFAGNEILQVGPSHKILALPREGLDETYRLSTPDGLSVAVNADRAKLTLGGQDLLGLSFVGLSRGSASYAVQSLGSPVVDDYSVWNTFRSAEVEIEEYWRVDAGIEHGYVIHQPISGEGTLSLQFDLAGPQPLVSGQQVIFQDDRDQEFLNWGELFVWDATGSPVKAEFASLGTRVIINVDDDQATYPLLVDPTFSTEAFIKASNTGASDAFGQSVAISDDTVVVGARYEDGPGGSNTGAAYVFVRDGDDWVEEAILRASNAAPEDSFGYSVAISGDTIVVGAIGRDDVASGAGGAYVFVRNSGTWTEQAFLTRSVAGANDFFGWSVGVSGDTVVVGAPNFDINPSPAGNEGQAYVFTRTGTTWSAPTSINPTSRTLVGGAEFGNSVSIDGSTIVIGAIDQSTTVSTSGAAYVFTGSGASWSEQAELAASDRANGDQFARSVAVSGDTVVVGAPTEDTSPLTDQGAAYVFVRSGTTWSQQQKLLASDSATSMYFGWVVDVDADSIAVGATGTSFGSAYLFTRSGTTWSEQKIFAASNPGAGDSYGHSVALNSDHFVVSALNEDSNTTGINPAPNELASNSGAVYIYYDLTPPATTTPQQKRQREQGSPGIFLTLTGRPGEMVSGSELVFGSFSIKSRSPYSLVLSSESPNSINRILASGFVSATGNLERTISLPSLPEGTYSIVVNAQSGSGALLELRNRVTVSPDGDYTYVTPENLQPITR